MYAGKCVYGYGRDTTADGGDCLAQKKHNQGKSSCDGRAWRHRYRIRGWQQAELITHRNAKTVSHNVYI